MKKIICIVDDTPDLLDNLMQFLEMEGYETLPCKGGLEALEKMQYITPDLIITDLWMPAMDGFTFVAQVKGNDRLKDVPVAIFTAKPLHEYEEKAKKAGIAAYIKKPATLEDILKIVDDLI